MPRDKISVVYEAANPAFCPASEEVTASFKSLHCLPEQYILYLGGYSARKNVTSLIYATSKLGHIKKNVKLVLAGSMGKKIEHDLRELLMELKIEKDVFLTGHFADEDMPTIYSGAFLFVYPSLYEGFGLPVIEAMACGIPVISSRFGGSISEVAGGAALLLDSANSDEIADAIKKIYESTVLREEMRYLGMSRANAFSWSRCARETLKIYQELLS